MQTKDRQYIYNLAEKGFKFFPCSSVDKWKDGKNTGNRSKDLLVGKKAPLIKGWQKDSTSDLSLLKKYFEDTASWVGFPTGANNFNIVVIDVDLRDTRNVDDLLDELDEINDLENISRDGFQVESQSGGRHLYFRSPVDFAGNTRYFGKSLPIDVQSTGKYIVFPDEVNYSVYDSDIEIDDFFNHLPVLPDWVVTYRDTPINNYNIDNASGSLRSMDKSEIMETRSALCFIDPDDRDLWVKIGMALKDSETKQSFGLWNEWSRDSDKNDPGEMRQVWNSFKPNDIMINTLFYEAQQNGWVAPETVAPDLIELGIDIKDIKPANDHPVFPKEIIDDVEGNLKLIFDYLDYTSVRPNKEFSYLGAIALIGLLGGQIYSSEGGTRSNLYTLLVGEAGGGKDSPRKSIRKILYHEEIKLFDHLDIESIGSTEGVFEALKFQPKQLMLIDEFGKFLTKITKPNAPAYLMDVQKLLLDLWSSADGSIKTTSKKDRKDSMIIFNPHCCFLGTTTRKTLTDGLKSDNVSDGFLSRMLMIDTDVFNYKKTPKERRNLNVPPSKEILDFVKNIIDQDHIIQSSEQNQTISKKYTLKPVPFSDDAMDLFTQHDRLFDEKAVLRVNEYDLLYNRTSQIAEQLALIFAISDNPDDPVMSVKNVRHGVLLAEYSTKNIIYLVNNHVSDNDIEDKTKRVLNMIKHEGRLTASALYKKTRPFSSREREDVLENLESSGCIIKGTEKKENSTRDTTIYIYIKGE